VSHAIFLRSILTSFEIYSRSFSAAQQGSLFAVMASSSALDDQVVSRASIILENQSDWKLWYSMKKQFATVKGVWEYCDPSTTMQPPTVDEEPLDSDSDGKWRKWEIKTNAQRSTLKAIGEVNLEIMRTVARSKLHLIADLDLDVRLRLKTLQNQEAVDLMLIELTTTI
jgi:hypothetical protein